MIGTKLKGFIWFFKILIDLGIVETIKNDFWPIIEYVFIISQDNIITVQLNDFLQTKDNQINIMIQKGKYFLLLFEIKPQRINHTAIPCHNVHFDLLICAIFRLVEDFPRYVVLEIKCLRVYALTT